MLLADRTVAGLRMISCNDVEFWKNIFIKGRESVEGISFDWKPENDGDQVTNCPYIVKNMRLDNN
jgi:hypothetical protein